MQNADQGEEAAGGVEIDVDFFLQPLAEQFRAFVMEAAAAHIEGFDPRRARSLDRRVIAFAVHEIILHGLAEQPERQRHFFERLIIRVADIEDQPVVFGADMQMIGAGEAARGRKVIVLQQIEDRHRPLMLDIGIAADHAVLVEGDIGDAFGRFFAQHPLLFGKIETDRNRARMGIEPFRFRERDGGRADGAQALCIARQP